MHSNTITSPHGLSATGSRLGLGVRRNRALSRYTDLETRLPTTSPRETPRHITPQALRRRFTVVERTALEWAVVDRAEAGEADRLNAATLRSLLKDIEQARQLDLDDPELADSLRRFEAFGLIAAGRAQEILDGPVQAHEQP